MLHFCIIHVIKPTAAAKNYDLKFFLPDISFLKNFDQYIFCIFRFSMAVPVHINIFKLFFYMSIIGFVEFFCVNRTTFTLSKLIQNVVTTTKFPTNSSIVFKSIKVIGQNIR